MGIQLFSYSVFPTRLWLPVHCAATCLFAAALALLPGTGGTGREAGAGPQWQW